MPVAGATMGEPGRPVVNQALSAPGVETRLGVKLAVVDATGIALTSGEFIPAQTVVWCAGTQASPLTASLAGERNRLGRFPEP